MKRAAESLEPSARQARIKSAKVPGYCGQGNPQKDESGNSIWPAPEEQVVAARAFLRECAAAQKPTLIVPDKDADGLSSGAIIHRTLVKLGLNPNLLNVYLVQKGSNIHVDDERKLMLEKSPSFIIILDQGSRGGPPIVDDNDVRSLLIDHHLSDEFPKNALVVSTCHYPPVATTSLTTYEICKKLDVDIAQECGYLCAIGTHGDLGTNLKWEAPFPDMTETFKKYTKKTINDCVSYINAPRRTGTYDVVTAWKALLEAKYPRAILENRRLKEARQEVNLEVSKHTHTPPKFSKNGKIAVLKINSTAQVHPVIATRWAGTLKSKFLEIVMCANYGYLPGKVNFSCRIAKCAKDRDASVNIIDSLKAVANLDTSDLVERLGSNFARGHKEASGGIVGTAEFEELCAVMRIGEKPDKPLGESSKKAVDKSPQKNTLKNYFQKD